MYTDDFYADQAPGSSLSASSIVPRIISEFNPSSVVDVGCGVGTWLAEFQSQGVADVLGIDGDYVERAQLRIPSEDFFAADLTEPLAVSRKFDLALCLEVAEHLPSRSARQLVTSLVDLSEKIVFSAAIPFQGGTHHVNEQWQSYWAELFLECGYAGDIAFRTSLWHLDDVDPWYIQNLVVYRRSQGELAVPAGIDAVHPRTYSRLADPDQLSVRSSARRTAVALKRRVRSRLST